MGGHTGEGAWAEFTKSFDPKMMASESLHRMEFDDNVASIISGYKNINSLTSKSAFFAPKIPKKKLKNAISKKPYRTESILKPEDIWVILDDTNFGSAKDGVLVTGLGLFWHEISEDSGSLPWRIGDSRVTGFSYEGGAFFSGELSAIIDGRSKIGLWKNAVVPNKAMERFSSLLDDLADYANSHYYTSRGEEVPADAGIQEALAGENTTPDMSGLDEGLIELIMAGEILQCPNCEQFTLQRKNLGGRALKGLARGFAKYARWESGQMGTRSMVGSSGGIFDSLAADAAFACGGCGYSESDGEHLDRTRG